MIDGFKPQGLVIIDETKYSDEDGKEHVKKEITVKPSKSGAVGGATAGAAIGSVVPGVGTAVGGIVGGVIGLVFGPAD